MFKMAFRPEAASTFANDVDNLFFTITALTIFFTVLVAGMLFFMSFRYRRGSKVDRSRPIEEHQALEIAWSVGPLVLALGIFLWSSKLFASPFNPPKDAKEVFVIGKQWMWHLQHANGIRENNELHVPIGQAVKLTMISQDVIHAFYVPEFRLQRQVQPGAYTSFYFTPNKVGKYHMYCNMYCGTQHSEMGGWVYVQSKADYQRWETSGGAKGVAIGGANGKTGGITTAMAGASLFEQYQCSSCHNAEAVQRGRGPSLVGIYGKKRQLLDGRVVTADDAYLRNAIYYPSEYALAGWPQGAMLSYKGQLTEEKVLQINSYIRGLDKDVKAKTALPGPKGATTPTDTEMPGAFGAPKNSGGDFDTNAPNANTDNMQWRYMYGGER